MKTLTTKWLPVLVALTLISCGGADTDNSSAESSSDASTTASAPPTLALASFAISGAFSGLSNGDSANRYALADASTDVCGAGFDDPDGVESRAYGYTGTYGASGYTVATETDDYCALEDGTENTGTGPDGDGLFRSFRVTIATSVCDDDGEMTNVYFRSGEGIYRNTADHFPEIYGSFTIAGTELNCTIKLNADGASDESYCTDSDNNLVETLDSSLSCALTPGVIAPETSGYNGIWAPAIMQEGMQSLEDPETLIEIGAAFVSVVSSGVVDAAGAVTVYNTNEEIGDKILDYYDYGIGVFLTFDSTYSADGGPGSPSAPQIPEDVIENTDVLDNLTDVTLNLAELAEEYDVHLFAPYNETDFKLDDGEDNYSSSWSQDVIGPIRERYSGTVMWKAAYTMEGIAHIDFSNYDVAGISLSRDGSESDADYSARIADSIGDLALRAAEGQAIVISEFGVWGDSDEMLIDAGRADDIVDAYELVFAGGEGNVDGFIAFDGPDGTDQPLYDGDAFAEDADAFDVVRDWFTNRL